MKKILQITLEFEPFIGGIATYVEDFSSTIKNNVVVLAPQSENKKTKDHDYKVIRHKLFFRFFWPHWFKLFFLVRKIIREEKVEFIFIHHILPVGYVAYLIKLIYGIDYIVFCHGADYHYSIKSKWKIFLVRTVFSKAKQVVFNSEYLQKKYLAVFFEVQNKNIVLYPSPSKIFFSKPSEIEVEQLRENLSLFGKRVLVSASRINNGKGFPHLLNIVPGLLKVIPNLTVLVIGDGPKLSYLYEIIKKNNLQNVVRLVGSVSHDELVKYFHLCELFVLLTHPDETRGEEGFGMVFLEAAAAGLPVVAGRSGGVAEAVSNGETGFIVDNIYQYSEVVKVISDLLINSDYLRKLGESGRERAKSFFSWETQVAKIIPFIE